jgi:hypothetical protein
VCRSDREIQQLAAVEAETLAAGVGRTVDDQRVRASAADRRRLAVRVAELDLKGHRPDLRPSVV